MHISINGFSLQGLQYSLIQNNEYVLKGRLYYKNFANKASSYMAIANFTARIFLSSFDLSQLSNNFNSAILKSELKLNIIHMEIFGREKLLQQYNKEIQSIINRLYLNITDKYFEFLIIHLIQIENIILNIYHINKQLKDQLYQLQQINSYSSDLIDKWINIDPYFTIFKNDNLYYYGYFLNSTNTKLSFNNILKDFNTTFLIQTINDIEYIKTQNNLKEISTIYLGTIKETFAYNFKLI